MDWRRHGIVVAMGVALGMGSARADSLELAGGRAYANCTVVRMEADRLVVGIGGREMACKLGDVRRLEVTGEGALSAAEAAYAGGEFDRAVDAYEKAMNGTRRGVVREWSALRMTESAGQAGRFDAAIRGVVALAESAPETAAGVKLRMPGARSSYLAEGIRVVDEATRKAGQKDATTAALLKILAELQGAREDARGKAEAEERLAKVMARMNPQNTRAQRAAAEAGLGRMRQALREGRFDGVLQLAAAEGEGIVEPADQAEALFLMAEAMAGKAAAGGGEESWKEAAVAYMRVVAHGPAGSPRVAESLLKTARICAGPLKDVEAARRLYRQVQEEFKGGPAAREATAGEEAMGK